MINNLHRTNQHIIIELEKIMSYVTGYSTGIVIKEQVDRKDYIDDFYAHHHKQNSARLKAANNNNPAHAHAIKSHGQRAQSLPNMLDGRRAARAASVGNTPVATPPPTRRAGSTRHLPSRLANADTSRLITTSNHLANLKRTNSTPVANTTPSPTRRGVGVGVATANSALLRNRYQRPMASAL